MLVSATLCCFIYGFSQPPTGYYSNAANKSCATLKSALRDIITNGNNAQTYGSLWSQYLLTDVKPRTVGSGSANVIWDIYSSKAPNQTDPYQFIPGTTNGGQQDQGSGGSVEGQFYNREHSVPQSWFNGSTGTPGPTTDYHHIFPTDKFVNAKRANFIYGEVASANFTSLNGSKLGTSAIAGFSGSVFEPIDEFKGDVARAFLYFVTRYEDDISGWSSNTEAAQAFANNSFPAVKVPYLQLMLKWHNQDPVSQKEKDRNNGGYNFQGNRNPFVDSPQYVNQVWNGSCPGLTILPVNIILFTGKLQNSNLLLQWKVGTEINVKEYIVEESVNGTYYLTIGTVAATGLSAYNYTLSVANKAGKRMYYRIKAVDYDGSVQYTDVFSVHVPTAVQVVSIYPNPASQQVFINPLVNATVVAYNANGNKVTQVQAMANQTVKIPVQQWAKGLYTFIIQTANQQATYKVLVQ